MNEKRSTIRLIVGFSLLSALTYLIQFLLFHQSENTLFYLLQDLAFVPIQVLIVTLVMERFLKRMENRKKVKKINVVISTFFADSGQCMLTELAAFDQEAVTRSAELIRDYRTMKYHQVRKNLEEHTFEIKATEEQLERLKVIFGSSREFLLSMLANPSLLEHDSFTDMLWAVFHVGDELWSRDSLSNLPGHELEHLQNDIRRAYSAIIYEWILYMDYLREEYPFLHALAVRKNPFANNPL